MSQRIETRCVQGGYTPGNGEPRQIPIIQSTTFKYDTGDATAKLFDLEAAGYFYSRLQNPTNDYVAAKIAAMEAVANVPPYGKDVSADKGTHPLLQLLPISRHSA